MMEPPPPTDVQPAMRRINPVILALAGAVILLLVVWVVAGMRGDDQDKLQGNATSNTAADTSDKLCAAQSTYDFIKGELFRRAAQVRGSDQAAYDRLAGSAVLRMDNPVMESRDKDTGAINCSGSLSLDLPPGVAVASGQRTLMSDVDYSIRKAADGSGNVVLLRNADAIVNPLATLTRNGEATPATAAPSPAPPGPAQSQPSSPGAQYGAPPPAQAPAPPAPSQTQAPAPPRSTPQVSRAPTARPSFDCSTARPGGEQAVCSDEGLAALDRAMASQYARARAQADPDRRELLRQTGFRFINYRDHCGSRACIVDAYTGRMREIRDIVAGDWRPPR